MSCAPHVPLPDVPAEAADAEDEGGDVPGRFEDLPVRTAARLRGWRMPQGRRSIGGECDFSCRRTAELLEDV